MSGRRHATDRLARATPGATAQAIRFRSPGPATGAGAKTIRTPTGRTESEAAAGAELL